jgi:hypothetical protein
MIPHLAVGDFGSALTGVRLVQIERLANCFFRIVAALQNQLGNLIWRHASRFFFYGCSR